MERDRIKADAPRTTADRYWTEKATEPGPTSGLLAVALLAVIVLSVV